MECSDSSIEVVIALDFGTSRSGYAYAFRDVPEKVSWNMNWGKYVPPYPKTRTCLLYSPQDRPVGWGSAAIEQLAELLKEKQAQGYYLIDLFKMQIKSEDGKYRNQDGEIYKTLESGIEVKVFDLVVDYLRFLKEAALLEVREITSRELKDNQIGWVLTIPAIWDDRDKQFMRQAAQKAGIISDSDDDCDRLIIALEPEVAAFYCYQNRELYLDAGTFMVVDCGGSTVDIVTYAINSVKRMEGVPGVPPTGGPYGSKDVDREFRILLASKLTPKAIVKFQKESPLDYLRTVEYKWETIKHGIKLEQLSMKTAAYVGIHRSLENIANQYCKEKFQQLISIQQDDESIHISSSEIESLFEGSLREILKEINKEFTLLGNRKCNAMFLVGGYSSAELLQKQVKQEFSTWVDEIVIPQNPEVAVLAGAVYFGMNQWLVELEAKREHKNYLLERLRSEAEALSEKGFDVVFEEVKDGYGLVLSVKQDLTLVFWIPPHYPHQAPRVAIKTSSGLEQADFDPGVWQEDLILEDIVSAFL